jgi:hypothetical protein
MNKESAIQIAVVQYIRVKYKNVLFTISPIVKLNARQGYFQKLLGYAAGSPDLILFEPRGIYHGLMIELKSEKGIVSENQKSFLLKLTERGYKTAVCYSAREAEDIIDTYMADDNLNQSEK